MAGVAIKNPIDLYNNFNTLIGQQTGNSLADMDTSKMITVGQAAQLYGYENTLNALSVAMGRVLITARPYKAAYSLIEGDVEEYGQIMRKISYFYDGFEQSKDWNTDIDATQFNDGQTIDPYTIRKRYPLEIQFGGNKVLEKSYTRFLRNLKVAFSNAQDFARFYEGEAVEISNEIQMMKEAENCATIINAIGATYNTGKRRMKVNLTKEYNEKFNTKLTTKDLLTLQLPLFTPFLVSTIKYVSDLMTKNNNLFHLSPKKFNDSGAQMNLYRHTPKNMQRMLLNSALWYDVETQVFPLLFNDRYLQLDQVEFVPYWQSAADGGHVSVTPNQFDAATGQSVKGTAVENLYVVGLLYDKDALRTCYHQENVLTTPINAKGNYFNTVYHWSKDYRYDATENMVLFYMADDEV